MKRLTRFDEPGHWMYHCDILEHAELEMMGQIDVEYRERGRVSSWRSAMKVNIVADEHGYTPSSVTLDKGKPATLQFTRMSVN